MKIWGAFLKILILTTYFPPDTAIAAVRPYMFAKYLTQLGHTVTVLRSGEINKRCENFFEPLSQVRVISYLGENSPAETYQRGEWTGIPSEGKSRIAFLPEQIRLPLAKLYHTFTRKKDAACRLERRMANHQKQKTALDKMRDESFDIVFSTVGEFENALAGQYAAKLFGCPLIQDFRDPMAAQMLQDKKEYAYLKAIQNKAVLGADACTSVSEGVLQNICCDLPVFRKLVLYNGFEPHPATNRINRPEFCDEHLTFCYTGQLYKDMQDFSPLFKALRTLSKGNKIELRNVRVHYAGRDFEHIHHQAAKFGLTDILVDHGHVGRKDALKIQMQSDVFLVLSWNTVCAKGVLTGKFYEGIRAKKNILSLVAGDVPYSELNLINEKYHYGFCYENCQEKEQFDALCAYLESLYMEKVSTGSVTYNPNPDLETDFRYDMLSKKLETLCYELIGRKNSELGV